MQTNDQIKQFDSDMSLLIDEYIKHQDFHAMETPLKTEAQCKQTLKNRLLGEYNFTAISKGIFNAVHVINQYLSQSEKIKDRKKIQSELSTAFTKLIELYGQTKTNKNPDLLKNLEHDLPLSLALFGISNETLIEIYEIYLQCFKNKEIENSKDLIQLLLIFAPTIPAFWNALGVCFQNEGNFDQALNHYLIAEEINPSLVETHFYLARCYINQKNHPLAKEQVEKLFKLMNDSQDLKNQWEHAVHELAYEIIK